MGLFARCHCVDSVLRQLHAFYIIANPPTFVSGKSSFLFFHQDHMEISVTPPVTGWQSAL
jgi:hypothetical protein